MKHLLLAGLVLVSLVSIGLFLFEGAKDRQNFNALLEVGGKTLRDVTETATSPIQVSTAQEITLGRMVMRRFRVLPRVDPMTKRVRRVGKRLAKFCKRKGITYRFYVLNSSTVNAYAIPGGYILVTRGMLKRVSDEADDAQLAWIVGHELMHIEGRHALVQLRIWLARERLKLVALSDATKMAKVVERLLRVSYSENMELESDLGGIALMRKADFDVKAALKLIDRLFARRHRHRRRSSRNPFQMGLKLSQETLRNYFATHPHWQTRRKRIEEHLKKQKR